MVLESYLIRVNGSLPTNWPKP